MGKWIGRIITFLLLGVFLFSAGRLVMIRLKYYKGEKTYGDLAEQYTARSDTDSGQSSVVRPSSSGKSGSGTEEQPGQSEDFSGLIPIPEDEAVPITVDFKALCEINDDIIGWIYCADSLINYPLVHAPDNDYYLDRDIKKEEDACGTLFSDESNHKGFIDSNVIIYGHHMQNLSMFATLKYWLEQEFYEEHPVMWILTPDGDYRLDLFSGYTTSATSDTYRIFYGPRAEFDQYLNMVAAQSEFVPRDVELDGQAHYVVLSTCAYSFNNARTVLHGKLTPVPSTGGKPNEGYK